MTKRSLESALLSVFLLSFLETTDAQVITGNILGTVRDETGAVVPGALVTIRSPVLLGGPATFVTNEKGQYRFPALAPGLYGLTVEISGFRTYIEEGLRVQVGATVERNVTLPLAALAESLTVTAESPLPTTGPCHYGIDTPKREELIAATHSIAEIARFVGADSLGYLSQEGLLSAVAEDRNRYCSACFSGNYPVPLPEEGRDQLKLFEKVRE